MESLCCQCRAWNVVCKNVNKKRENIVGTPPLSAGGEVESPTKFSKRGGGGLTGPQLLEGGCWERRGGTFFRGVAIFTKK